MKGLFPQYDIALIQDFDAVWKEALFVFDTNVLLNLYRYQPGTREELLKILEKLGERIWIPHHVALEFQRNRLTVIADQNNSFSKVQQALQNAQNSLKKEISSLNLEKRHSSIDPQPFMTDFSNLVKEYLVELNKLQEAQQKIASPDPLKEKIEELFSERMGPAPMDQYEVDSLYKEAEVRGRFNIPPGFRDLSKGSDRSPAEYSHDNIIYNRKYGDYLVWQQMLWHAKAENISSIIFVTDDGKEDWWRIIEEGGPKTIGPRRELLEEAVLSANIKALLMYKPEQFLKYAKNFLNAPVSEETLQEIRDISIEEAKRNNLSSPIFALSAAISEYIDYNYRTSRVDHDVLDYIIESNGEKLGYILKPVAGADMADPTQLLVSLRDFLRRVDQCLEEDATLSQIIIYLVTANVDDFNKLRSITTDFMPTNSQKKVIINGGIMTNDEIGRPKYVNFPLWVSYPDFRT